MGSGTERCAASVPLKDFIAETRPEITEPIMIPTTSVNPTKKDAMTAAPRPIEKLFDLLTHVAAPIYLGRTNPRCQVSSFAEAFKLTARQSPLRRITP